MVYYLVQPYGPDPCQDATILSQHSTPEDAYEELDLLVESIQRSSDGFTAYVVDEQRQPVPRPVWE